MANLIDWWIVCLTSVPSWITILFFLIMYFVGKSACPYYARAELLGDKLERNLTNFKLHKILKQEDEWEVIKIYKL